MIQVVDQASIKSEGSTPPSQRRDSGGLSELAGKASTGAVWTIVGLGGGQVVRLISNLILTRLLITEYFGLMALVNVFLLGLQLFSDIGVGPALIQDKREDPDFVNTVWTIQAGRGLMLCLIAIVLATPYAAFYHQPVLTSLVQVAALTSAIRGFTSTSIFTQTRHLHLGRPIMLRIGAQLLGTVVMVVWAWFTRSIWSLVIGGIITAAVTVMLSHVWIPGVRSRFRIEKKAARSLFSFGSWIFLSTLAIFAADQLDRLILGRITTMASLGVYSVAVLLAVAPTGVLSSLSRSVLFPLYSRVRHSSKDLAEVFRASRWPLLILGGWSAAGFIGGGPTIIRLLYDSRYWEAGWMLQILSAGLWFGIVLGGTHGAVVLAVGRSDWTAAMAFSKVVGIAAFVPLGYWLGEFPGAIAGLGMSELVRYAVSVFGAVKLGFDDRRRDLRLTVRVGLAAFVSWSAVQWLNQLGMTNVALHSLAIFVLVTALWARPLWILLGRVRRKEPLFLGDLQVREERS